MGLQGPTEEFFMQGRETYWQASGKYFLYFCQRYEKWRIASIEGFGDNMDGSCYAFVSDSMRGRDIRNRTFSKDWIEVENGQWVHRHDAGVSALGTLGEQMGMGDSAEAEGDEAACNASANEETPDGSE